MDAVVECIFKKKNLHPYPEIVSNPTTVTGATKQQTATTTPTITTITTQTTNPTLATTIMVQCSSD